MMKRMMVFFFLLFTFGVNATAQDYVLTEPGVTNTCGSCGETNAFCCMLAHMGTNSPVNGYVLSVSVSAGNTGVWWKVVQDWDAGLDTLAGDDAVNLSNLQGSAIVPAGLTLTNTWISDIGTITNVQIFLDGRLTSWTENGTPLP